MNGKTARSAASQLSFRLVCASVDAQNFWLVGNRPDRPKMARVVSDHHPQPHIVVTVVRMVVVAVRRARVVPIVVERPAAQHAVV